MARLTHALNKLPARRATALCGQNSTSSDTRSSRPARLLAASMGLALLSSALVVLPTLTAPSLSSASAQEIGRQPSDPNAQLLLKADELVYDNDNETVTARGDVQLDYDGYNVVAREIIYDQKTRRVKGRGNVEIIQPDGTRIYADEIDLTDDFGDGFINALRVETPDNTRFTAESAERFEGQKTVFNHGIYTACEPCKENPERAPLWQVKASKVILNGETKTVTYENARFELFGLPIAYLPYFSHADPSVKRKTGFLIPNVGQKSNLGWFYKQSFFWATGDTHDLTLTGTYYAKQGFLAEAEWRQRFDNGQYNIRVAGISQNDPAEFSRAPDTIEIERGMVSTSGSFNFNPRWQFGWNLMSQSDSTFSNTYDIQNYATNTFVNDVYLRGLGGRSFFELAAYEYQNQGGAYYLEEEQPFVRPVLDYNLVTDAPATGGELSLDVNVTSLDRKTLDNEIVAPVVNTFGTDGESSRISANLAWQKSLTTDGGFTLTPFLGLRGDATNVDANGDPLTGLAVQQGTTTRFMPTAGFEASYPILARTETSTHVFEPMVQVLLRPDLNTTGILPNEDAQSLVFDATTLFSRDKFSGYDRIESGTRANVGLRYSGVFSSGFSLDGTFGQSFHLAGDNPFTKPDLVNVGIASGLDRDQSDYVGSFALTSRHGLRLNAKARFDKDDFGIERAESRVSYANANFYTSANYIFIAPQPEIGIPDTREQVTVAAGVKLHEHWRAFGNASYDIKNETLFSRSVGLTYHDECFTFSLAFRETNSRYDTSVARQSLNFRVAIRTIGDFQESIDVEDLQEFGQGGFLDGL